MLRTRLCEILSIEYPIIQGGLHHLGLADLCAAVAEAGGLGQITAVSLPDPEGLRQEIRKVRAKTARPFGVNLAMGYQKLEAYIDVALEEGVRIFSISGGNPEPYIKYIDDRVKGAKKLVLVAGVRAAQKAESLGADAVVAVGFDGGGHLGRDDIGTLSLIPLIVDAVKIPVVAGGGIVDGRGLMAALALGAEGVQMGTRFVATKECPAHPAYKELLTGAKETDTVIIKRSIGRPARVIRTGGAERILEAEARGATVEELLPLISGKVNRKAALEGDVEEGFVYAGQGVGLIRDVPSVAELFGRILAEAKSVGSRLGGLMA